MWLFSVLFLLVASMMGQAASGYTRQQLLAILLAPGVYDSTLRPFLLTNSTQNNTYGSIVLTGLPSPPVIVELNYRLDLLFAVSSQDEQYSLSFFMTEKWYDPRLTFSTTQFSLNPYSDSLRLPNGQVWTPDTYFFNAVKCTTSDSLLKLDPLGSGLVTWTRHLTCTFYTPFDLSLFPFDSQTFPIKRLSFFYNSSELSYRFSSLGCFQPDPRLDYVNALWALNTYSCTASSYNGAQDELTANLYVSRLFQNYVLKNILPLFLLVLVSALSYFIDPAAAPARVGLSVSIVLSVSTFNLLVSQDLPKINYSTLLDWYVWECFLFVILAVGEFAFVNHLVFSKAYTTRVPRLVDDFFQWGIPIIWGLSNLIYWPVVNDAFNGLLSGVLGIFIIANFYRIFWCYRHEKEGVVAPFCALYNWIHGKLNDGEQAARVAFVQNKRRLQIAVSENSVLSRESRRLNSEYEVLSHQSVVGDEPSVSSNVLPFALENSARNEMDRELFTDTANEQNNVPSAFALSKDIVVCDEGTEDEERKTNVED